MQKMAGKSKYVFLPDRQSVAFYKGGPVRRGRNNQSVSGNAPAQSLPHYIAHFRQPGYLSTAIHVAASIIRFACFSFTVSVCSCPPTVNRIPVIKCFPNLEKTRSSASDFVVHRVQITLPGVEVGATSLSFSMATISSLSSRNITFSPFEIAASE